MEGELFLGKEDKTQELEKQALIDPQRGDRSFLSSI